MMQQEKFSTPSSYTTLEDIRRRKDELSDEIDRDTEKIGSMWSSLFTPKENATKGEYVASLVSNTVTAIDAFLLIRKLMKSYSGLFNFFRKKKTSRRK